MIFGEESRKLPHENGWLLASLPRLMPVRQFHGLLQMVLSMSFPYNDHHDTGGSEDCRGRDAPNCVLSFVKLGHYNSILL